MYTDYAFGSRSLTWDSREVAPWPPDDPPMQEVIDWLGKVHESLMTHVRGLTDAELTQLRPANWGEEKETRWLLSTLLQHDVYHAGEINRMRSILAGEDRWQWEISLGIERQV